MSSYQFQLSFGFQFFGNLTILVVFVVVHWITRLFDAVAPKFRHGNVDHLVISEVRPGSVAHRTGTVHAGDKLLAVDGSQMDAVSLEDATLFLQTEEVVRLKLQKGESEVGPVHDHLPVVYTVELVRHGGPLGVTISGTENPNDSIVISGLTEGSVVFYFPLSY